MYQHKHIVPDEILVATRGVTGTMGHRLNTRKVKAPIIQHRLLRFWSSAFQHRLFDNLDVSSTTTKQLTNPLHFPASESYQLVERFHLSIEIMGGVPRAKEGE